MLNFLQTSSDSFAMGMHWTAVILSYGGSSSDQVIEYFDWRQRESHFSDKMIIFVSYANTRVPVFTDNVNRTEFNQLLSEKLKSI